MLYEFVTAYRDAIIAKTSVKVRTRPWPPASSAELENGLPMFLTQLAETLRWKNTETPFSTHAIAHSATRHGRDLLALGFTVSQVVHDYGDICQAITELAVEQNAPITTEEFHVLNRCLDTAIADAVTEHARITAESRSAHELERMGQVTHEIRNVLTTAILAFDVVKRGTQARAARLSSRCPPPEQSHPSRWSIPPCRREPSHRTRAAARQSFVVIGAAVTPRRGQQSRSAEGRS